LLFQRQRCAAPGVSSLIDGEAVACDENGYAVFEGCGASRRASMSSSMPSTSLSWMAKTCGASRCARRRSRACCVGAFRAASERAPRPRWRERIPARLQDKPRGHRVEAARVALPIRPIEGLAEVQEPGSASGEARGGGGVGEAALALTTTELCTATGAGL